MKKLTTTYLVGASIAAFFLLIGNKAHADCSAMPTCDRMLYTQTSCGADEESVRCPFDTTKVKCITHCDLEDYPESACPDFSVCAKCQNKYKVIGCKPGYRVTNNNDSIKCSKQVSCPTNYILSTDTCPAGAFCDSRDVCIAGSSKVFYKVTCYGEQNGYTYFDTGTRTCESALSVGDQIQLNEFMGSHVRGVVLNTYKKGGDIYADLAVLDQTGPDNYALHQTHTDMESCATPTNLYLMIQQNGCFGTKRADLDAALSATTQHTNTCPQGIMGTWDNALPDTNNPLYNISGTYHLPNVYELYQMHQLGLLDSSKVYWTSLNNGIYWSDPAKCNMQRRWVFYPSTGTAELKDQYYLASSTKYTSALAITKKLSVTSGWTTN